MKKYLLLLPLLFFAAATSAQTDTVSPKINKLPHKHVDAAARFLQGDFKTYIATHLQYNHKTDHNITGNIILLVVIEADGSINNVTILKSLSPIIDPEVAAIIKASPKWQPAVLNGQKVSMDIVFNIDIAIKGPPPALLPVKKAPMVTALPVTRPAIQNNASLAVKTPAIATKKPVVKKPAVIAKVVPAAKKPVPPVLKKSVPVIAKIIPPGKKPLPPVVKKPVPVIAKVTLPPVKKPVPPVVKKPAPIIAKAVPLPVKKSEPPVVKKPTPVIAKVIPPVKKSEPSVVKKPAPIIAKAVPLPVKKSELPVVKKPTPVIAKVIPPVKKPVPVIAKVIPPAKKPVSPVVKKPAPVVAKIAPPVKKPEPLTARKEEPPVVKKKRVVMRADLFHPSGNYPVFPGGGLPAFFRYLGENIVYPPDSKKNSVAGNVVLTFTVNEEGHIEDVEVISSPAEDLSQEAIRVLLASPKWKPAKQNGTPVPVSYQIPIKFTLAAPAPATAN